MFIYMDSAIQIPNTKAAKMKRRKLPAPKFYTIRWKSNEM